MSVIDRAIKAMRDTGLDCESWPDDVLEILVQAVLASTGAGELWQYVAIAEELDAQAKEIYVAPQPIRSEEFARIRAETIRGIALRASRIREAVAILDIEQQLQALRSLAGKPSEGHGSNRARQDG